MLASMSEIHPGVDVAPLDWSADGVSELVPTGTVTLLLADIEGEPHLPGSQLDATAIANLDRTLIELVREHHGVCPVDQGEGDSFLVAFARASDAVACALGLQRAPLAPIRLRIGMHTGEVSSPDGGNCVGSTINRTARLRELAHGGQTVLSGTTSDLVADLLPTDAWLNDLGTYRLEDLPRPERVVQLCHPDLHNEFPPLRTRKAVGVHGLPAQLTRLVGRVDEVAQVRGLLDVKRWVTLTGVGGVGKTRLATQVAGAVADGYPDGVWYVNLAPITDPALVPVAAARVLGLPDEPGRSTVDTIVRRIADRRTLLVLDNCEHLVDGCAALIVALLGACPALRVLATSREPIAVAGEQIWRVPPLGHSEAIELFTDRAREARPEFDINADNLAVVTEICHRLDGMPLAIELAASRVRALTLTEIVDSLHDRFRLLTGGSRIAVRRQQTMRASVDWSHALLTGPEQVLFRRLAVFPSGFDLDGAQAAAAGGEVQRYEVVDLLSLLVDKSLVVTDDSDGRTRYRLLETVRQYALEKLRESGDADAVRARHRDHYAAVAAGLDAPSVAGHERRLNQAELEIDNLRAAFAFSRENGDTGHALLLASCLQPLWRARSRLQEGLAWFAAALADRDAHPEGVDPGLCARALADRALIDAVAGITDRLDDAQKALAIARDIEDPALLARALTACGGVAAYNADLARPWLAEAVGLARAVGDKWRLAEILAWQAYVGFAGEGDPGATRAAGEEARRLADEIGDAFVSRACRWTLAAANLWQGNLEAAVGLSGEVIGESDAAHDMVSGCAAQACLAHALAHRGDTDAATAAAQASIDSAVGLSPVLVGSACSALVVATLAAGDVAAAEHARDSATQLFGASTAAIINDPTNSAQISCARGDLNAAHRLADGAASITRGVHRVRALTIRCRIEIAQGDRERAERDAHDALSLAAAIGAYLWVPDILECLASVMTGAGGNREAVRLVGAADAARGRMGAVRFVIYRTGCNSSLATLRKSMGDSEFDDAWAEGSALSIDEAIAYAQRGRGARKRPTSGWGALTPMELDVALLVGEGLSNKEIGVRLFISPRTVHSHLTHVYTKLGLSSRLQLAQQAARRGESQQDPSRP
ncbi:LuxR family transcriptional regulator [Mycobacterium canetti]|uniref:LuxR family transcriptional regulator n=1 Tax=Mycobacterium canetti TaxID=78331 RepID=UPI001E2DB7FA|nr:LuxR family transcriptional regulator [Mycobacterium canetti]